MRNLSYSELFADDLSTIFIFKKPGRIRRLINSYLESLVEWLFKWRLKMNASKCSYTIFSKGKKHGSSIVLRLNGDSIPYNSNPVFLGIVFDEHLNFKVHFENLRTRALKRLNILKIFSHRSWLLNCHTLINIYRALIGSIFDYSFFSISCFSESSLGSIQKIQNRAIRTIFYLDWDSPTDELPLISGLLPIKTRFLQVGSRYLLKSFFSNNKLTLQLMFDYIQSWSAITSHNRFLSTPYVYY